MTSNSINPEDIVFHALFIGTTGAGKTNALLYWLLKLFSARKDVALVLIDPPIHPEDLLGEGVGAGPRRLRIEPTPDPLSV